MTIVGALGPRSKGYAFRRVGYGLVMRVDLRLVGVLALLGSGCFSPDTTPIDTSASTSIGNDTTTTQQASDTTTSDGLTSTTPPIDSSGGPVCDPPQTLCGDACVDTDDDDAHCGGCDQPCDAGQMCSAGQCMAPCDAGLEMCGGACVDTDADPDHCGGCDMPCRPDQLCNVGSCALECDVGLEACGGACVQTDVDNAHCGGCDMPCEAWEQCSASACLPICDPGLVLCDGACVNPDTDSMYCGAQRDCAAAPGMACVGSELCSAGTCQMVSCVGFSAAAFDPVNTIPSVVVGNTHVSLTWDGMFYWSGAGGSPNGDVEAQQDAVGATVGTFAAGFDFRTIFTQGDGTATVYGRAFNSSTILIQDSPGVFLPLFDLVGAPLDSQAAVAWDDAANEFLTFNLGTLARWNDAGAFIDNVLFIDYGMMAGENDFPQNRGISWASGCYLTYNNGTLSAWDPMGTRVDTATLNGSSNFTSNLSLSFANGNVWVSDDVNWSGYAVF